MLVVGGGPAGMAAALHIARLQRERGGDPLTVAVLEKARENGAHCLSGAVLDPSVIRELVPNCESLNVPLGTPVQDDRVMYFTPSMGSCIHHPFVINDKPA